MPKSWFITIFLGALWLAVASLHAYYHSAAFIRKNRREASSVPFIGGVFAVLAVAACPWHSPFKWGVLFLALLLDLGSLPFVVLLVISLAFPGWLDAVNKRRNERVRRILEAAQASSTQGGPQKQGTR